MAALPQLVPSSIADYHVSRARCQKREKRGRRKDKRAIGKEAADTGDKGDVMDIVERAGQEDTTVKEDASTGEKRKSVPPDTEIQIDPPAKKSRTSSSTKELHDTRPAKPEILNHLVLGINETIKSLERSIEDLKLRLVMLANTLNASQLPQPKANHLLPTAPRSPSPPPPLPLPIPLVERLNAPTFILIPIQSISPQSLVSPIPQYCATFNSLIYQYSQLVKVARTRLKGGGDGDWEDREEVRVVPMGRVEEDMAGLGGLRRLACLAVRVSGIIAMYLRVFRYRFNV